MYSRNITRLLLSKEKTMDVALMEEEIKRYLKDDTYRYAILLDGGWGTGKT